MGLEVTQASFLYKPRNILKSLDNVGNCLLIIHITIATLYANSKSSKDNFRSIP